MAGSLNRVMLIGNIGKDPEIRATNAGLKIANLSLATSESWTDKASGERKEKTEWHRIVCMNERTTDVIEKFVRKGGKVFVEGSLQTRKWTDPSGAEKHSTEIVIGRFNGNLVLLDSRRDADPGAAHEPANATKPMPAKQPGGGYDLDDSIPFGCEWR